MKVGIGNVCSFTWEFVGGEDVHVRLTDRTSGPREASYL